MSDNPTPSQEETTNQTAETGLTQDDKTMGMLCHLAAFAGLVVPFFGSIIGPLVVWLLKKDQSSYVDYHGKESLNFQITMAIAFFVSWILVFVLIGFFLLAGLAIFNLVVIIIAAIKANEGVRYQYPFNFRFIK